MRDIGFNGRMFLTDEEHQTYLRRPPVRYSARGVTKDDVCCLCGKEGSNENPLQIAHKIPFIKGVKQFKLTPDYLDSKENLVTAHRSGCNKKCELSNLEIQKLVKIKGPEGP